MNEETQVAKANPCEKCGTVMRPIAIFKQYHAEVNNLGMCCPYCEDIVTDKWDENPNPIIRFGWAKGKTIREIYNGGRGAWYITDLLKRDEVGPHLKNRILAMLGQPTRVVTKDDEIRARLVSINNLKKREGIKIEEEQVSMDKEKRSLKDLLEKEEEKLARVEEKEEEEELEKAKTKSGILSHGWTMEEWEEKLVNLKEFKKGYIGPILKRLFR